MEEGGVGRRIIGRGGGRRQTLAHLIDERGEQSAVLLE
jgi:hypothetical protein